MSSYLHTAKMVFVYNSTDWKQPKCPTRGGWPNSPSSQWKGDGIRAENSLYATMKSDIRDVFLSVGKKQGATQCFGYTFSYENGDMCRLEVSREGSIQHAFHNNSRENRGRGSELIIN